MSMAERREFWEVCERAIFISESSCCFVAPIRKAYGSGEHPSPPETDGCKPLTQFGRRKAIQNF